MLNKQTIKFLFIIICLIQTFYIFHFRSGFKCEILKSPFSLNSGEHYAVSPEVLEARDIIKKNKLSNFNLSDSLKGDIYFYQRVIEFNYPIRIKDNSDFIIMLKKETIPTTCKLVEKNDNLILTQCKNDQ